jgi:exonuclease V gamma subunit
MNTQLNRNLTPVSYEVDYVQWVEETLTQLKAGRYGQVDWPNLFEEIEDMSRRQRDALESNLIVLLLHLLKWQYQPTYQPTMQTGSWKGSIREHRRRINKTLQTSPSLQPYLLTVLAECYGEARLQAADETGLAVEEFPVVCGYPIDQVLTDDFLPEG